jgi:exportin-2 (importin alpha re-exporter)
MEGELRSLLPWLSSGEDARRRPAEARVLELGGSAGYCASLLRIVESESRSSPRASLMAATLLLRCVRSRWEEELGPIGAEERVAIRACLPGLAARSRASAEWKQLREVVAEIGYHDFPGRWPTLMSDIVSMASSFSSSGDFSSFLGSLSILNSCCKRFRNVCDSEEVVGALRCALEQVQAPLLRMTQWMCAQLSSSPPAELLCALRLACRTFYSLNWLTIPEFFEDNIAEWMGMFQRLLMVPGGDAGPARLRVAVMTNVCLYSSKYDEEFSPYWPSFAERARSILIPHDSSPAANKLVCTALRFFASSVTKTTRSSTFGTTDAIATLVYSIAIPNAYLTTDDEEMFEYDSEAFVACEMEASELETRRKLAFELLKSIASTFPELSAPILKDVINTLMKKYETDGSTRRWTHKEVAVSIFIACAKRMSASSRLDIPYFLEYSVLPEINGGLSPLLTSSCLRFVWSFMFDVTPLVVMFAKGQAVRIAQTTQNRSLRSMACIFVERAMCMSMFKSEGASDIITAMLPLARDSEDDRAMACVARATSMLESRSPELAARIMAELVPLLARLLATGKESSPFGHYLFEALAALTSSVCADDARHAASFEAALLPHFNVVISGPAEDIIPYALQIVALLLRMRPEEAIPAAYAPIIDRCLSYDPVKQRSFAPYVSEIICEYIPKCGPSLPLSRVINLIRTLIRSASIVGSAFRIINCIFVHTSTSVISEFIAIIINDMIKRYGACTNRVIALPMICSLSILSIKHGADFTLRALDSCQPGCAALHHLLHHLTQRRLSVRFLREVWAPTLLKPAYGIEYKHMVLGTTLLITHPPLHSDPNTWAALVAGLTTLCFHKISSTQGTTKTPLLPPAFDLALQGNKLRLIQPPKLDAAPSVADPPETLFVRAMQSICTTIPDFATPAIRTSCNHETQTKLQTLLSNIK